MTGFAAPDPITDLLFRLERDLSERRILASSEALLMPDGGNADLTAAIQATQIINQKTPGHKRIKRLVLRYAAIHGGRN